ncbi:MAG: transglycosylase SLT domain-containing protein, partial [Bacteroidaceae bacterium]|nr:transglycosylase SLT domain-containing protein [Bacteroidaceae bacterium]
ETTDFPETMLADMDSLYWDWQSKNFLSIDENCVMTTENPSISDSIYIDRLSRIPSIIEMPFNEIVKKHIEAYTTRLRNKVSFILAAANFYMPLFEEALDTYDLPLELKYLPIIESALNPTALSRQRASGLWQFMLKTGKIYGLENNSLVDERRDPIKSTWAAARYLKDLYNIYKDWNLVLAAYNCGPGNVNKAIRRAGGATDYWEIYPFLPKETRGYVPGFIAANYVMNYYCEHGICPMETQLPETSDTIHIHKDLNLNQVAGVCNIDIEQLRSLNPQYKKDIVPGNSKPYILRLPNNTANQFIELQDSIYAYKANQYLTKRKTVAVNENSTGKGNTGNATYHKIRQGDNLGKIAAKYGTTVNQLRKLNNLKGNNITAGKTLRIR